jgi:hypothetical protein
LKSELFVLATPAQLERFFTEPVYHLFPTGADIFHDDMHRWISKTGATMKTDSIARCPNKEVLDAARRHLTSGNAGVREQFNKTAQSLARASVGEDHGFPWADTVDTEDQEDQLTIKLARLLAMAGCEKEVTCRTMLDLVSQIPTPLNRQASSSSSGISSAPASAFSSQPSRADSLISDSVPVTSSSSSLSHAASSSSSPEASKFHAWGICETLCERKEDLLRQILIPTTSRAGQNVSFDCRTKPKQDGNPNRAAATAAAAEIDQAKVGDWVKKIESGGVFRSKKDLKGVDLWVHVRDVTRDNSYVTFAIQLKDRANVQSGDMDRVFRMLREVEEEEMIVKVGEHMEKNKMRWELVFVVIGRLAR